MGAYDTATPVGIIDLSTCTTLTVDVRLAVPDDVLVLFSRLRLPGGEVTVEALDRMTAGDRLEEAARELADADVSALTFACTTGSLLHGPGFDERLRARITQATGVPASTTATAVVAALRQLGARSVAVGTPYTDDINEREVVFLEDAGFEIPQIIGLSKGYDREIRELREDEVLALAREAHVPGSDALFLSCTNLPVLALIPALEAELGVPVVTSNQATLWHLLRLAGVEDRLEPSLGRLVARRGEAAPRPAGARG
jgi:maleate isomerase